jgi:two-component system chemotaxis response regulator CheY
MMPRSRSVLVVDDQPEIRDLLKLVLAEYGYPVRTAEHGAAALETIKANTFGVILLDIQMPVMDGLEFVQAYRAQPGHQAPLVVITAGHDAKQYAEMVQADAYLSKPFDLDTVLATVGELIGDQEARGSRNSPA